MSFDIALSGIQAINDSLDTTSHNIANAGTYGYKSLRSNFASLVAGTQVTGVMVGSTTQNISLQGSILNTGRSLDASINGTGFFIARDAATNETQYTRVGIFDASTDGYLVDASGRKIQGYPVDTKTGTLGALGDLAIPTGSIPAVASSDVTYIGNLSADWTAPTSAWVSPTSATDAPDTSTFNMSKASVIYDSLGGKHTLTQYFSRTDDGGGGSVANSVDVHYVLDGLEVGTPTTMTFDGTTGQMLTPDPTTDAGSITLGLAGTTTSNGGVLNDIVVNYTGTTGFAGEATTSTNNADGYAAGTYSGLTLDTDGSVIASYSNGQKQTVGKIAIATFPDEGQLTAISDTSWITSTTSGEALVGTPGTGMAGSLTVSSLEQSNVDITSELVGLMTSQRNYQANSKVIQTESTMLQSLMQAI
ncbi:flagellar hook-basal body complex protein [Duganella sp. FT80W]|uniref:Flagellar hook protein FlgE n=1 Tax=Duganella guangzhouensis TaxID=2666084 RepID=A0A6I2KX89_9BURK|nr:flagellar hook-basal body complex protein [Duganella guangzhouensis]MRW90735.1 flagellar hook-basal body complex protein [Duganella guangzhouensis]